MAVYKDGQRNTWFVSVCYKDYAGKNCRKVKRGFKTLREGKQWERDFLNSTANSPKISFKLLSELYIADMEKRLKASTVYSKTKRIKSSILPFFKSMEVESITPAIVRQWHNTLLDRYSPSSQKLISSTFSSMMNYAIKYHGLKQNPCAIAGTVGTLQRSKESITFWTSDDFKKFIKSVPPASIDYVIFNLLYFSGMRIGELLALNIEDFNQDEGYIKISKTLDYTSGKMLITPPKTKTSNRNIYLPANVCKLLKSFIDTLSLKGVYTAKPTDRLFNVGISTVRRHLANYCALSNVRKIRVHDFRHSHASLLIELNTPPLAISERLGHENVTITLEIYSHLYPNKQENIIRNLEYVYQNCITDKRKNTQTTDEQRLESVSEHNVV